MHRPPAVCPPLRPRSRVNKQKAIETEVSQPEQVCQLGCILRACWHRWTRQTQTHKLWLGADLGKPEGMTPPAEAGFSFKHLFCIKRYQGLLRFPEGERASTFLPTQPLVQGSSAAPSPAAKPMGLTDTFGNLRKNTNAPSGCKSLQDLLLRKGERGGPNPTGE